MRDRLKPVVKTEEQFLFVCHLVGPFFQRFHIERTRCMLDVCHTENIVAPVEDSLVILLQMTETANYVIVKTSCLFIIIFIFINKSL